MLFETGEYNQINSTIRHGYTKTKMLAKATETMGMGEKHMKKRVVLWLLIILLLALNLLACGAPRPAAVVRDFMGAANRGDINTMLDCMEPDAANLVRGVAGIAGDSFGIDADSVFLMAPGLMSIANAYGAGYGVDYDILGESVHGDRAVVTVNYSMTTGETVQSGENSEIPLVKIKGRWYLAMS